MRNKLQTILFFLCCLPFIAQADETVTYLHHDVLGSVIGTSDNAGKLQKTEYLSYGTKNGVTSNESSELGYTGKPHFKDLGLSYYGSRWYDPDAGRFTGIDPVAWTKQYAVHSFNRYSYANNNPYKYVDPDGELPFLIPIVIVAGLNAVSLAFEASYDANNPCSDCVRSSSGIDLGVSGAIVGTGRKITTLATRSTTVVVQPGRKLGDKLKSQRGAFGESPPPLKQIHSKETLTTGSNRFSYDYWGKQSTDDIIKSLKPGLDESLKIKPDGRIMNGNTRTTVLQERGFDINSLPRDVYK